MTVSQLINKLSTLHPDLKVVIGIDEDLEDICFGASGTIQIEFNDGGEKENVFVLAPCFCDLDEDWNEEGDINSQPHLN